MQPYKRFRRIPCQKPKQCERTDSVYSIVRRRNISRILSIASMAPGDMVYIYAALNPVA